MAAHKPLQIYWPRSPPIDSLWDKGPVWLIGWTHADQTCCVCHLIPDVPLAVVQAHIVQLATHSLFVDIPVDPPRIIGHLVTSNALAGAITGPQALDIGPLTLVCDQNGVLTVPSTTTDAEEPHVELVVFDPSQINFTFHLSVDPLDLDIASSLATYHPSQTHKTQPYSGTCSPAQSSASLCTSALPSPLPSDPPTRAHSPTQSEPTELSGPYAYPGSNLAGPRSSVLNSTTSLAFTSRSAATTLSRVIDQINATRTIQGLLIAAMDTPYSSSFATSTVWHSLDRFCNYISYLNYHFPSGAPDSDPIPATAESSEAPDYIRFGAANLSAPRAPHPSASHAPAPTGGSPLTHTESWWSALSPYLMYYALLVLRVVSDLLLRVLNFQYRRFMLKRSTAIGQQIDLRLRQITNTPWNYIMLRRKYWNDPCRRTALYVNFYNHLWQIVGDVIIGLLVGQLILAHHHRITHVLHHHLCYYAFTSLESMIEWLMGWPAGMKLNPQLDEFLGELFLWLIRLWTLLIHPTRAITAAVVELIGQCGILGASVQVALLSDYISLMTLHIYWFYAVAARIYHWQLAVLHSLLNLFRGRRINPLRCRIDSCNFELDQLLLGTILLALVFFLFPTIAVYYLTFATSRVGIIVAQGGLEMILAALNHFPGFALTLRLLLPRKFPGGVQIHLCASHALWTPPSCVARGKHHIVRIWATVWGTPREQAPAGNHQTATAAPSLSVSGRTSKGRGFFVVPAHTAGATANRSNRPLPLRHGASGTAYSQSQPTRLSSLRQVWTPLPSVCVRDHSYRHHAYLRITNYPLPLSGIFFQYFQLWKQLGVQYFSLTIVRCVLTGELIRPVPRLHYNLFPESRPSLQQMWHHLVQERRSHGSSCYS
ncbi:pig-Q [Dimargaris verticillata]|uniref:Pig-Q n=1 Tax=Dimargaris verticillata TaxID=2761393 RepID=A0A9W8B2M9_9FUNG|nr:pig-Q [Dimargaris verticillata]